MVEARYRVSGLRLTSSFSCALGGGVARGGEALRLRGDFLGLCGSVYH